MPKTYLERVASRKSTPKLEEVLEKPSRKPIIIASNAARPTRGDDELFPGKGNSYGGSEALSKVGGSKGHQAIKKVPLKKKD
jgi:hypothetical protein